MTENYEVTMETTGQKFIAGDYFNSLKADPRARRLILTKKYGREVYNRMRVAGWVAAKWPHGSRQEGKPWGWYVHNKPGAKEYSPGPTRLFVVGEEKAEGGVVLHMHTSRGTAYTAFVPDGGEAEAMECAV